MCEVGKRGGGVAEGGVRGWWWLRVLVWELWCGMACHDMAWHGMGRALCDVNHKNGVEMACGHIAE